MILFVRRALVDFAYLSLPAAGKPYGESFLFNFFFY